MPATTFPKFDLAIMDEVVYDVVKEMRNEVARKIGRKQHYQMVEKPKRPILKNRRTFPVYDKQWDPIVYDTMKEIRNTVASREKDRIRSTTARRMAYNATDKRKECKKISAKM